MNKIKAILPKKWKFASILALSFTSFFTVLVFGPLDIYIHNPTAFITSWKFFTPPLIITALIGVAVFFIFFVLLWNKKTWTGVILLLLSAIPFVYLRYVRFSLNSLTSVALKMFIVGIVVWILLTKLLKQEALDVVLLIFWGVFIIAYFQGLLLNGEMALLTGDKAPYDALTPDHIFNAFLWLLVTVAPLCTWIVFRIKGKEFRYEKPLVASVLIICAMQVVGIISAAATADLPPGYEENPQCLSYAPTMNYSAGDNVCVFILDRLDVDYMNETLEEYPELYDQLDGFTFYRNNISEYVGTFPSVPKMLTEHYYTEGLRFSEYWQEAWPQHTPIDTLRENGYTTNLLISKLSTYGDFSEIEDKTDNIEKSDLKINYYEIMRVSCRISAGRLAPYLLKNIFLMQVAADFGNLLFTIDNDSCQNLAVGAETDRDFYNYMTSADMTADNDKPVFNFIHMNCAHVDRNINVSIGGYRYNFETGKLIDGGNYVETTRACFEILNEYFKKMKEVGVYDNTTIILLGDHGKGSIDPENGIPIKTSLLIKPQDARGELKLDDMAEMSNKYLGASILESAGLSHEDLGVSYFDIIGGEPAPARLYYHFEPWWAARNTSERIFLQGIYEVTGDAGKWENWKLVSNGQE